MEKNKTKKKFVKNIFNFQFFFVNFEKNRFFFFLIFKKSFFILLFFNMYYDVKK
jgi:hypothetical protein